MHLEKTMFREYDIRGRESPEELNARSVEAIVRAYGTFLLRRGLSRVVVGHDSRATSLEFKDVTVRSLVATGCEVFDIGLVLTPMLYWGQFHFEAPGGVMVTASHNPAGWNGLKLALGYSRTLGKAELDEVQALALAETFTEGQGSASVADILEDYIADVKSRTSVSPGYRVVLNAGNGTAGPLATPVLRAVGCEVVELNTVPDPSFPHYTPNPSVVEMMEDTARLVVASQANLGVALDADGDRLGVVDDTGAIVWADRFMIPLCRVLLAQHPGAKIVFDVKCSKALEEDIIAHRGTPVMWKTGHSYIKEKLVEVGGALGLEMSGHIFWVDGYYGFDDAVFSTLKILEYLSVTGQSLSQALADIPSYVASPVLNAACPDDLKYQVVDELTTDFSQKYDVIKINGARIDFGDGWGLVRASSNLPQLTLRFEAHTEKRLREIEDIFRRKLSAYPFVSQDWRSG